MHMTTYLGNAKGYRVFFPFCGKQAFDSNQEESVSLTCEHVLFQGSSYGFDVIREDIADEYNEGINPKLLSETPDAEYDDEDFDPEEFSVDSQIMCAQIRDAICIRCNNDLPPCACGGAEPDGYIGFSPIGKYKLDEIPA